MAPNATINNDKKKAIGPALLYRAVPFALDLPLPVLRVFVLIAMKIPAAFDEGCGGHFN
ncbi:hypothetical protein BBDE_0831 [Bifidobacterium dentium JCM 1195 = DSM 20436]|nr:hypothetical protein BBDE_0831 [Bifidobacterium dentium JCM 1195 = DSM 20436]